MNDQYYIGVCTECGSDQPASYMEKTRFQEPPCRYCGGVVNVIPEHADKQQFLKSHNESRGINTSSPQRDDNDD